MDEISTGKKNESDEGPISNVNFNSLINKINEITSKGRNVDMKNKKQFLIILKSTSKTLQENKNIFESLRSEENMIKLFDELENTIEDVESKLNKLALIKFCKSKAEKYLKNVSEKLENINMILLSYLASRKNKHVETKIIEKENIFNNNNNTLNLNINSLNNNTIYNKNFLKNKRERTFSNNINNNNNNNSNNNMNIVKDNSYMSLSTDKKESVDSDGLRDLM